MYTSPISSSLSFVRDLYRSASSICRRERSINGKRSSPYVDTPISPEVKPNVNTSFLRENTNRSLNNSRLDTSYVDNNADHSFLSNRILPEIVSFDEMKPDLGSQANRLEKTSQTGSPSLRIPRLEVMKDKNSNINECEIHEKILSVSESYEALVDGERPMKKIKLSPKNVEDEEKALTQEWNDELTTIKNNLSRINQIFDAMDGTGVKQNFLKQNTSFQLQDTVLFDQTINESRLDLSKLNITKNNLRNSEGDENIENNPSKANYILKDLFVDEPSFHRSVVPKFTATYENTMESTRAAQ